LPELELVVNLADPVPDLPEMHHPPLLADCAEKQGSLNWLTAPNHRQL